jgi:1,4-alpha-glucan branching enzyme
MSSSGDESTQVPSAQETTPQPAPQPSTQEWVKGQIERLVQGEHHEPHSVLGAHPGVDGQVTVRVWRPDATAVTVLIGQSAGGGEASDKAGMRQVHPAGVFEATVPAAKGNRVPPYQLEVIYGERTFVIEDAYRFLPSLGELDIHLFNEGRHQRLWELLGAHPRVMDGVSGVSFAVWAPNAKGVRVVGDFNSWDGRIHPMRTLGSSGVWELFLPGVGPGAKYKYELVGADGRLRLKADPFGFYMERPPATASIVYDSGYTWGDDAWVTDRDAKLQLEQPLSAYEVHLGSWRKGLSYRELAQQLGDYLNDMGFTHVEFMPVAEHPYEPSWGYQVSGYYAPTSRFGNPDDFRYLVDHLHQRGIGVIIDWVPAHFPKDDFALARFDGTALYEHEGSRGEHPDWGSLVFNFGRAEVRNFLIANALYWLEEFHVDGVRIDAVASMLYLDYSRKEGEWQPNIHGGNEDLDAIQFLKDFNTDCYGIHPGAINIAEESTAFSGVTRPVYDGGLGFGFKWNMGWMHDSLEYISKEPIHRKYHHGELTFSLLYAYSENYVLPISHDEVVHGKGTLLARMPGDEWQRFANLRAYLAYMWSHPGKQLIFMGCEIAQDAEWNEQHSIDWDGLVYPPKQGIQALVRELNRVYRSQPALFQRDSDPAGFTWTDSDSGEDNVLGYLRWDKDGEPLACLVNFSPVPRTRRVGLPKPGPWTAILNTDDSRWGGSGVGTGLVEATTDQPWQGQPASAEVTFPPLATVWLAPGS